MAGGGIGILFAEDDDDAREVMVEFLKELGFDSVEGVATGEELIERFDIERHQLVMADMQLGHARRIGSAREDHRDR
jgi:CheY-like chemotaxis protein